MCETDYWEGVRARVDGCVSISDAVWPWGAAAGVQSPPSASRALDSRDVTEVNEAGLRARSISRVVRTLAPTGGGV